MRNADAECTGSLFGAKAPVSVWNAAPSRTAKHLISTVFDFELIFGFCMFRNFLLFAAKFVMGFILWYLVQNSYPYCPMSWKDFTHFPKNSEWTGYHCWTWYFLHMFGTWFSSRELSSYMLMNVAEELHRLSWNRPVAVMHKPPPGGRVCSGSQFQLTFSLWRRHGSRSLKESVISHP